MNIDNYKYVLSIYEQGSISAAARSLGMTQPALSISLGNLEKSLGYEIFERKSKPIRPTAEGMLLIDFIKQHTLLEQDFKKRIDDLHSATATITIGGPGIYLDSIVVDAVRRYRQEQKNDLLVIKQGAVPKLIEETLAGRMDAFISTSGELPPQLELIPIRTEKLYLCIPREWKINEKLGDYQIKIGKDKGKELDVKKISGLDTVSLLEDLPLQRIVDEYLKAHKVALNTVVRTSQATSAVKIAAKGIGIVIASEELFTDGSFEQDFRFYKLKGITTNRQIYMVYDKTRYLSENCKKFLELFR